MRAWHKGRCARAEPANVAMNDSLCYAIHDGKVPNLCILM